MRFIVFGEDWAAHPSSTQHLIKEISQEHEVSWVNSVGMRTPKFSFKDIKRVFNKFISLFSMRKKSEFLNEFTVYNAKILPWHQFSWVNILNKQQIKKTIPLLNTSIDDDPIIYWISVPTAISMIDIREQDKVIYYCGDDFSGLDGVDYNLVAPFEKELINRADIIYVVSDALKQKMPHNKTFLLRHGVDFKLFNMPANINEGLQKQRPTLGFYGSISNWVDLDLLKQLVKARPEYDLLLIGKSKVDLNELLALKNVKHIEAINHNQLPHFSQHWQVALLPFVDNAQIRACDPLKLKEYLASGAPIVSTSFPAVDKYKETVLIANDVQGFIERVDWAVNLSISSGLMWRQNSSNQVKQESWQQKSHYVLNQLKSVL
ncbi:glycosyltransferase [Pseudoalteromonas denitrificans]|uniref:Glycosyltransferase involved in cell wall bisynthesis n=1 Tax=Pseudoalteromonas denitrificans DSM 6059 TaxID=1123010 RepID=A0A1I1ENN5_9GAMM|nr:glycosyltransferase [Pseudoalteromonas denitrificans]SFB88789.1 Glycosyltransferase involved in cell wall bisynthesis [Pseudoalteromonas denitrificans DSM 6059]